MKLVDEDKMIQGNFVSSYLTKNQESVARERARQLQEISEMEKKAIQRIAENKELLNKNEIRGESKGRGKGCAGCEKCKGRLENPHAPYHLTPFIDDSKI